MPISSHVVVFDAPRRVRLERMEQQPPRDGEVLLCTLYSGISAGTELTAYRGTNPYMHKRWDGERRLFVSSDTPDLQYPIRGWGYEEVGEVVKVGDAVHGIKKGDVVYGTWGHRAYHIMDAAEARQRLLPDGLSPILGIFSQIGAIALNGVHDAALRIGETVAVFGLGVPGQIVAQLCRASGVRVIGVDLLPARLQKAQGLGALDEAIPAGDGAVAERIRELTDGRGADVVLEVSGSAAALHEAIRAAAYSARVVTLGFFQGEARQLYLGEEFHHNRINLVCSQISGVAPELSYRWDRLRLAQTAMALAGQGLLQLAPLISHVLPYQEAAEAFCILDEQAPDALQVVLDFTVAAGDALP